MQVKQLGAIKKRQLLFCLFSPPQLSVPLLRRGLQPNMQTPSTCEAPSPAPAPFPPQLWQSTRQVKIDSQQAGALPAPDSSLHTTALPPCCSHRDEEHRSSSRLRENTERARPCHGVDQEAEHPASGVSQHPISGIYAAKRQVARVKIGHWGGRGAQLMHTQQLQPRRLTRCSSFSSLFIRIRPCNVHR